MTWMAEQQGSPITSSMGRTSDSIVHSENHTFYVQLIGGQLPDLQNCQTAPCCLAPGRLCRHGSAQQDAGGAPQCACVPPALPPPPPRCPRGAAWGRDALCIGDRWGRTVAVEQTAISLGVLPKSALVRSRTSAQRDAADLVSHPLRFKPPDISLHILMSLTAVRSSCDPRHNHTKNVAISLFDGVNISRELLARMRTENRWSVRSASPVICAIAGAGEGAHLTAMEPSARWVTVPRSRSRPATAPPSGSRTPSCVPPPPPMSAQAAAHLQRCVGGCPASARQLLRRPLSGKASEFLTTGTVSKMLSIVCQASNTDACERAQPTQALEVASMSGCRARTITMHDLQYGGAGCVLSRQRTSRRGFTPRGIRNAAMPSLPLQPAPAPPLLCGSVSLRRCPGCTTVTWNPRRSRYIAVTQPEGPDPTTTACLLSGGSHEALPGRGCLSAEPECTRLLSGAAAAPDVVSWISAAERAFCRPDLVASAVESAEGAPDAPD